MMARILSLLFALLVASPGVAAAQSAVSNPSIGAIAAIPGCTIGAGTTQLAPTGDCPGLLSDMMLARVSDSATKGDCTTGGGDGTTPTLCMWAAEADGGNGEWQPVSETGAAALGANLTAIQGLTTAADQMTYWTGSGAAAQAPLTSFARTILDDTDASSVRSTIGAGTGSGDMLISVYGGSGTGIVAEADNALGIEDGAIVDADVNAGAAIASTKIGYTPTTAADYDDPDPTTAQGALDALAARVHVPEFVRADAFGSLAAAIAACPDTASSTNFEGQCIVQLPFGAYNFDDTVIGSLTTALDAKNSGVTLRGYGSGHTQTSGSVTTNCASTLNYTGTGGASSIGLDLQGTRFVVVEDLCIDGNGTLETAIRISGDTATGMVSRKNRIESVHIVDITGTAVLITGIGGDTNDDIAGNLISSLLVTGTGAAAEPTYCVRQTGGSAVVDNVVSGLWCTSVSVDGVLNDGGGLTVQDSYFGDADGASIRFTGDGRAMHIVNNSIENDTGHGIVSEYGTGAGVPVASVVGNLIGLATSSTNHLDWNHKGALLLSGNVLGSRGGDQATRGWRITPGGASLWLSEGGNNILTSATERSHASIRSNVALRHSTDCTALTGEPRGRLCWEEDANTIYGCEATDGVCDSPGDWTALAGGGGSGYATIDDEDTPLTQRTTLNFAGSGISCVDDTTQTTCTVAGGSAPVDSVFGRTGVVTALQADYDSFFLTAAEGNAAYATGVGDCTSGDCLDGTSDGGTQITLYDAAATVVLDNAAGTLDISRPVTATSFTADDPGDGSRGVELVDNTATCADPTAGSTSICTIGGEPFTRDTGGTAREILYTAGGDYGDFTCSAGTCTVDASAVAISTDVSGLGTGVATVLGTPSSANLAGAVTDETGTGALVFAASPVLTTPDLGTPSAATLTNATGLPASTGLTGIVAVANGGTGAAPGAGGDDVLIGTSATTATWAALPTTGTSGCSGTADKLLYNTSTNAFSCGADAGAGGGMTSFSAAGTSGTPQTISDGNTLTIAAGDSISTTAGATDTVTVAVADNGITDAKLATTHSQCFGLWAPSAEIQATDDVTTVWRAPVAVTITEVYCETTTGTVTMDVQIDDGTPADVMGADLVCDATGETDNTGLTGSMAAGDRLDFAITSVATNPTGLSVCIVYTR